jgi:hypothetical protein
MCFIASVSCRRDIFLPVPVPIKPNKYSSQESNSKQNSMHKWGRTGGRSQQFELVHVQGTRLVNVLQFRQHGAPLSSAWVLQSPVVQSPRPRPRSCGHK